MSILWRKYSFDALATLIICTILGYGLYLRILPLPTQPYWMDEGYTVNAILAHTAGNTDGISAVLDSGQKYECFVYCYLSSLLTDTFGNPMVEYRALSVVFGMLMVFAVFGVTRELYNRNTALLAALFTLFAYFQIAWSTQARWYTLFSFLTWLAIYFFVKAYNQKNQTARYVTYTTLSLATALLATLTHKMGVILPFFIATSATVQVFYVKQRKIKQIILWSSLFAIVTILLFFKAEIIHFIVGIQVSFSLPYYTSFLLREYWGLLPFALFALATASKREWWLFGLFLIYLIPLTTLTDIVHYRYIFHVVPVLYILGAVGVFKIAAYLPVRQKAQIPVTIAIALLLFFISPTGSLTPQDRYWLEADDPTTLSERPSYAYTPQPDWNGAYGYIRANIVDTDLIISSQPQFTKIFLNQPGYWMSYNYLGIDGKNEYRSADNREFYVGAQIIDTVPQLQELINNYHGYIVYDYMAYDGRIEQSILDFIDSNTKLVYQKNDNSYSKIWVYQF